MDNFGKIRKFLLEWAEMYYRSKDVFHKKIISMDKNEEKLIITFKEGEEAILAFAELEQSKDIAIEQNTSIITLNNRKNVDCLYENWEKFSEIKQLKIYFINPFSTTDKKWIINPYIHSTICDVNSLRTGLIAMFETVEPLTLDILEKKLGVVQS